ncbi:MAG: fluoride efflux transporter FluC [Propionibacteriaceae bacterium]
MSSLSERCPTLVAAALVYSGAVLGTLSRWGLGLAVSGLWGTHLVNIGGTALLGFLTVVLGIRRQQLKLFLGTGFCGAFTTYSSLAVGIAQAQLWAGIGHAVLALATGLASALIGMQLGSMRCNRATS